MTHSWHWDWNYHCTLQHFHQFHLCIPSRYWLRSRADKGHLVLLGEVSDAKVRGQSHKWKVRIPAISKIRYKEIQCMILKWIWYYGCHRNATWEFLGKHAELASLVRLFSGSRSSTLYLFKVTGNTVLLILLIHINISSRTMYTI